MGGTLLEFSITIQSGLHELLGVVLLEGGIRLVRYLCLKSATVNELRAPVKRFRLLIRRRC